MNKENAAIFEMLVCAALWSIAGIFIKLIPWNGFAISGLRSLIAGITIAVYMAVKRYRFVFNRRVLAACIMTVCVYTSFVCANKLTTAANAIVLQFTSPVFIVVFSVLFKKEKIRRADILAVVFTLAGIAMFFLDKLESGYIFGNIVSILAGMFMAGMFISVGDLEGENKFSGVLLGQFLCFLIGLPFILATKPEISALPVISIIVLGVFQLGISYILYIKASLSCPPLACCLLGALEPLLNPLWVFLFNGERPGTFALVGSVIVIVSVTLWCIFGKDSSENKLKTDA